VTTLLWIDRARREAWQQMAVDLAMIDAARAGGVVLLRLYQWSVDTLSLGANEAAGRTWDRAALERDGVPCVRRPSGGRGVWHAATDLTYAWVGPSGGPAGVRRRYRELHDRLGAAMASCGVATALAGSPDRPTGLTPGACFDAAVGGEVLVAGRKAVGSAQKVLGSMLLQHGAIALDDAARGAAYRLDRAGAAQSSQVSFLPDAEVVVDSIAARWLADGAVPARPEQIARIVDASVEHQSRFRDPNWTWRR
jgi:lipoate-protein ligase A